MRANSTAIPLEGILHCEARLLLPDFTTQKLSNVVSNKQTHVLGLDHQGQIVASEVISAKSHGRCDNKLWKRVSVQRVRSGRGPSISQVNGVSRFKVYTKVDTRTEYKTFPEIYPGAEALMLRYELIIQPLAEQVLIGKMLGDGSLQRTRRADTACIQFGHKKDNEEYVKWTIQLLGDVGHSTIDYRTSGYGTKMARAKSLCLNQIWEMFKEWGIPYKQKKHEENKQMPTSAIQKIGPIALAFWYMDDGSLAHNTEQEDRACFATNAFNNKSIQNLQAALAKFDIAATAYKAKGWRLRLNADDAEKLFLLIAPYIPHCMQYKLPERYRGAECWHPQLIASTYKPFLSWQKVLECGATPWTTKYRSEERR